jgi:hypothetical protein
MKKELVMIFIFVFGFALASADSSTTTTFNIGGCSFSFNGDVIGVDAGQCSTGSAAGYFYCDLSETGHNTLEEGLGCAMGNAAYDWGNNDNFCCPAGMTCNEIISGVFQCQQATTNPEEHTNEVDCNNAGFIWFDDRVCVSNVNDLGCIDYTSQPSCLVDEHDLGLKGIGSEFCGETIDCNNGETYSITSCLCEWNAVTSKCQAKMTGTQFFVGGSATVEDIFEVSTSYSLGECIDGEQGVSWSTSSSVISGFGGASTIPADCIAALTGDSIRFCGEDVVKMPGFSLFALLSSMFLIGAYYFFSKE